MDKFVHGALCGAGVTIFLGAMWFNYPGTAIVTMILTAFVTLGLATITFAPPSQKEKP